MAKKFFLLFLIAYTFLHLNYTFTIVYQYTDSDMRLVPNSNFNFGISTGDQALQPEMYNVMEVGADRKSYDFTTSFNANARK